MRDLTLLASRSDPDIREHALKISTGLRMRGPVDSALAVESFVKSAYVFVDEADELLIDPSIQLQTYNARGVIEGDCDDASMLSAALLFAIGQRVRFKAVESLPDGSFSHVFMEYYHSGLNRWIPVDATIDGIPVYRPGDYITQEL